jgi:hypothetical protein
MSCGSAGAIPCEHYLYLTLLLQQTFTKAFLFPIIIHSIGKNSYAHYFSSKVFQREREVQEDIFGVGVPKRYFICYEFH